jgi:drug/metabolite transporter (DMT)-like permease
MRNICDMLALDLLLELSFTQQSPQMCVQRKFASKAWLLMRAGMWGYGVQILVTKGLEYAPAARAMTMAYTSIIWGEVAGMALFQEFPNAWAVLGIVVVIAGTFYSARGQQAPARDREAVPLRKVSNPDANHCKD